MTQSELAEKLCFSDKAVSKWERGISVPDAATLYVIAKMFGVSVQYLFEEHQEFYSQEESKKLQKRQTMYSAITVTAAIILTFELMVGIAFAVMSAVAPETVNHLWVSVVLGSFACAALITFVFRMLFSKTGLINQILLIGAIWLADLALLIVVPDRVEIYMHLIAVVFTVLTVIYPWVIKKIGNSRNNKDNGPKKK